MWPSIDFVSNMVCSTTSTYDEICCFVSIFLVMEQGFGNYDEHTIDSQDTFQNQDSSQQQVTNTSGSKRQRT